jgi:hypothetical protein
MFSWLFGKGKKEAAGGQPGGKPSDEAEAITRLQQEYWTHRPEERTALQARGWDRLSWSERLRLHHLNCLAVLDQEPFRREMHGDDLTGSDHSAGPSEAQVRCRETATALLAPGSPYRPRIGMVWQGSLNPQEPGPPDLEGVLSNASLTHLGCLEVMRLDEQMQPRELAFVPLDDVSMIGFASPKLFRAGKLFYETGQAPEVVFLPLLYGISWHTNNEFYRAGRLTRFLAYPGGDGPAAEYGIGLGQQDLVLKGKEQQTLFGLGSVAQLAFALEMTDRRFDQKCRARGLDPDEVRRQIAFSPPQRQAEA